MNSLTMMYWGIATCTSFCIKLSMGYIVQFLVICCKCLQDALYTQFQDKYFLIYECVQQILVFWALTNCFVNRASQYITIMNPTWCTFHSIYWESKVPTCFEHYLFILRKRCTNSIWYIACVCQLAVARLQWSKIPSKKSRHTELLGVI
jgi:hypothetical protein